MPRQAIHTAAAPKAIGTYTPAIRAGDTVYISGQIPIDPATGELVRDDIEAESAACSRICARSPRPPVARSIMP